MSDREQRYAEAMARDWNEQVQAIAGREFSLALTPKNTLGLADEEQAELRAEVERLRRLADRIITVHEQVVMDTPEDRALHDKACATFRAALSSAPSEPEAEEAEMLARWNRGECMDDNCERCKSERR